MSADTVDDETKQLIIRLQLEDLQQPRAIGWHESDQNGDNSEATDSFAEDAQLAVDLYTADLTSQLGISLDVSLSKSIAKAVQDDGVLISQHCVEEQEAVSDRELAISLAPAAEDAEAAADADADAGADAGCRTDTASWQMVLASEARKHLADDDLRAFEYLNIADTSLRGTEVDAQNKDEAKAHAHKNGHGTCISCSDLTGGGSIIAPCGHEYCCHCLQELFMSVAKDQSLFPPRCCRTAIPFDAAVREVLPLATVGLFMAKKLEYETPNPTYCHNPVCSSFIPTAFVREDIGVAECHRCRRLTCVYCKGPMHEDTDCPENPDDRELLALAEEQGWMRCKSCRRIIELHRGCNHMTCYCKAQFCYECGETWKTCTCEVWHEHRLMDNAIAIVARAPDADQMGDAQRDILVQQARNNLVRNHDCDAHCWFYRSGNFRCSECHQDLPRYIYECRMCRILACRRCRYNRL